MIQKLLEKSKLHSSGENNFFYVTIYKLCSCYWTIILDNFCLLLARLLETDSEDSEEENKHKKEKMPSSMQVWSLVMFYTVVINYQNVDQWVWCMIIRIYNVHVIFEVAKWFKISLHHDSMLNIILYIRLYNVIFMVFNFKFL